MAKAKTKTTAQTPVTPALDDPLAGAAADSATPADTPYDRALQAGEELRRKPYEASTPIQITRQHAKGRMTVWERIEVLQDRDTQPTVLYQNWGRNLDGASIVTADRARSAAATSRSTATISPCAPARWTRPTAASSPT